MELAPSRPEGFAYLPGPLQAPARVLVGPVARAGARVTGWYLRLFQLEQSWSLFGPDPVAGTSSLDVLAWRRAGGPGGGAGWSVDTIRLQGARERPLPHLWDHRAFRVIDNFSNPRWVDGYLPWLATYLCRQEEERTGERPEGLEFVASWHPTRVPWQDDRPDVVRTDYGGYACGEG